MQKGEEAISPTGEGPDKRLSGVTDIVSPGGTSFFLQESVEGVGSSSQSTMTGQQLQTQGRLVVC